MSVDVSQGVPPVTAFSLEEVAQLEAQRHTLQFGQTRRGLALYVDIHLPDTSLLAEQVKVPVLVSYHGGGLINGSRRDAMFPELTAAALRAGVIIVYPDYRLLKPSSCWHQLEDVDTFLDYLSSEKINKDLTRLTSCRIEVDKQRLGITGFSAGSYLARLAIVASVKRYHSGTLDLKFKSAALFFGMGGDMLLDYWIRNRISPDTPSPALADTFTEEVADSPYTATLPGYGASIPRSEWCAWLWDTALFSDLCFDEPGFASRLSNLATSEERESALLAEMADGKDRKTMSRAYTYEDVIPQLFLKASHLAEEWPSTLLLHGSDDPIVPLQETMRTVEQLEVNSSSVELFIVRRGDHGMLDFETGAVVPDRAVAIEKAAQHLCKSLAS